MAQTKSFTISISGSGPSGETRKLKYEFQSANTISDVKLAISDQLGHSHARTSLMYHGQVLNNHRTLSSYGIKKPTTLSIIERVAGGCFVDGTHILLSNMKRCNIENVKVGDKLFTYNLNKKILEKNTVLEVLKFDVNELITIDFRRGSQNIICTESHPFYVVNKKNWCSVNNINYGLLCVGDKLLEYNNNILEIKNIKYKQINNRYVTVRTLCLDGINHNYFANDILVHNKTVPGPNLNDDSKVEKEWSNTAPAWRKHDSGLNIEFEYNGKKVIGQVGYFDGKWFNVSKHYRKAYCPHFKVYCPSIKSIGDYYFNCCKVTFKGQKSNEENEFEKREYYRNKPTYYSGGNDEYDWLEMKVEKWNPPH